MLFSAMAAAGVAASAVGTAAVAGEGSLYPQATLGENDELSAALGGAAYVLNDIGQDEAFRRAVNMAIAAHPNFHVQASLAAQARAETRAARAALYPRISANINGDYVIARRFGAATDNVVESLRPDGQINAGASVSQLIFDGGATFAKIRSAKARRRENALSLDARVNELALSALSAYHDLAVHQAILTMGREYIAHHEKLLADVKERERLGSGTKADVLRATARLAAARGRISQIEESAQIAEIRYTEFFSTEPGRLNFPSFDSLAVGSQEEAIAMATSRNPVLAAAVARADGARADYKAAKASRIPELRANVSGTKFDVIDGGGDYDVRAGVTMNYDIFAGGARGAEISSARSEAERQRFEEEQVRQEIGREAAIAFEQKKSADARLAIMTEAVISNDQARDLVAERFRVARGDLLDLLQAENDWFDAGVAFLTALAERDMTNYQMMEFTGDLLRFFSPQPEYAGEVAADG
ncbi:MAG: TolC family protein [Parvularculaceae bacterium]